MLVILVGQITYLFNKILIGYPSRVLDYLRSHSSSETERLPGD